MRSAIFYHPDAFTVTGEKLMGRNAAGASFLRAFIQNVSSSDPLWIQVEQSEHLKGFSKVANRFGHGEQIRVVSKDNLSTLSEPGLVFYPGPGLGGFAQQRGIYGHANWSLCGITHTTSSAIAMDSIVDLVTSPVQTWDALICTSRAVKNNVETILYSQIEYLKDRLGITKIILPQLPIIPLGIHTDDFKFSDKQKHDARNEFKISKDEIVVLFVGRLSFHAKAHPLAMYQALQEAKKRTSKKIVLIECGWYANSFIEGAFKEAADLACPDIRVIRIDGRNEIIRNVAWASADIFCSLSDNIQETFGISPVEAMAAGLPVVVSDWDGYRDTVRNGIDGFLIPTIAPPGGYGKDLSIRHALGIDTYDMYCGHTSSLIAIDIEETIRAFEALITSSELRHKMGRAGLSRAREVYEWSVVIKEYDNLSSELSNIRNISGTKLSNALHTWPARLDPFYAFSSYPTKIISSDTKLSMSGHPEQAVKRLNEYCCLRMISYANYIIPKNKEIGSVFEALASGPKSVDILISSIVEERKEIVLRSLTWLLKLGVIKIEN